MIKLIAADYFPKKLIFFKTKDTRMLLFLAEHYTIKMDINRYHLFALFANSTALTRGKTATPFSDR